MFEIGIFCVILLAACYWATMFVMGRRDDVIHGKFVHAHEGLAAMPAQPSFPKRPVRAVQPARETAKPVDSAALQSLLAAIQQDLKNVA